METLATDDNNLFGGTELQFKMLEKYVHADLRHQIDLKLVPNSHRFTTDIGTIYNPKRTVVWTQQAHDFLEAKIINDHSKNVEKIVFVSDWQRQKYIQIFQLPAGKCAMIPNGIEPASCAKKPRGIINLVYFSTPYRGLEILLDSLEHLRSNNYHLHVFSSMDIYGQPEENKKYENLYQRCERHEKITYYGSVSHDTMMRALDEMHIMAYPCIFEETCCISALEAMSQKLKIICSDLGALSETTAGFARIYPYTENKNEHAKMFAEYLDLEIERYDEDNQIDQKKYVDHKHDWNQIKIIWENLFREVLWNDKTTLRY